MGNKKFISEFTLYLSTEKRRAKHTVDSYLRDLNQFVHHINERPLQEVSPTDIKSFINRLVLEEEVSESTQNRKIATLRTFYGKFMIREGYIELSPTALIDTAQIKEKPPEPVSLADIDRLSNAAENFRDKLIIELLYATGARRFELAKMKFTDINNEEEYVKIIGKKGKTRTVPIHEDALKLVDIWKKQLSASLKEGEKVNYIFPGRNGEGHISNRRINEIVSALKVAAGLESKNITPHKLRHSFCSHLWQEGADILTVKDLAGHAKTDTTLVYTKLSSKRTKEEYNQFHPRARIMKQKQESLPI